MTTFRLACCTLVLLATLSACSSSDETLVIYSGRSQNLVEPLLNRFAEESGTSIEVNYGDTADMALLLSEEGDATDADVFLAQSPGAVAYVDGQGLLAAVPEDVLDAVPAEFVADDGNWIGVTGRQRVLVYNADLVDESELPASVDDLVTEPYRGRVAVAPPNGSFQDFVSAMRVERGDEATSAWLAGLVANDVATYANNNSIVDAVSRGEIEMGLVNHYYNARFLDENPDLSSVNHRFPDGDIGALVLPSTASVVAGTDQPEAAADFVRFLLSDEAQRYFADETFEYPLVDGVEPRTSLPALADQDVPEVDYAELGGDLTGTLDLIRDAGLSS